MPAVVGQVIMTLPGADGVPVLQLTINFTDGTGALRNANVTTSDGVKNGAVVVDNRTGRAQRCVVRDGTGAEIRSVTVPPNGAAYTVAQMSSQSITNMSQLNGISFDLT